MLVESNPLFVTIKQSEGASEARVVQESRKMNRTRSNFFFLGDFFTCEIEAVAVENENEVRNQIHVYSWIQGRK